MLLLIAIVVGMICAGGFALATTPVAGTSWVMIVGASAVMSLFLAFPARLVRAGPLRQGYMVAKPMPAAAVAGFPAEGERFPPVLGHEPVQTGLLPLAAGEQ